MNITLIAEGHTPADRQEERWGVSFLIDTDVLFDAFGKADVFFDNICRYSIDISTLKHIVISHDDWDHIAGLWGVLEKNRGVTVYVCANMNPDIKKRIQSFGVAVVEVHKPVLIRRGVYSTGEIAANTSRGVMYEQSMILKTFEGVSLVTGCAHPGIDAVVERSRIAVDGTLNYVIGGFHLKDSSLDRINEVVVCLRENAVGTVIPLHCTGQEAVRVLEKVYGRNCGRLLEGQSLIV